MQSQSRLLFMATRSAPLSAGVLLATAIVLSGSSHAAYIGTDGIIAIEAEAADTIPTEWRLESSVTGFSGDGYLRALVDSLGTPGRGVIGYDFRVDATSDYQFAFRSRIGQGTSNTEHNDTWVRVVDDTGVGVAPIPNDNDSRNGTWHKVYMNINGAWSYNASNKDRDPHSLSWTLNEEETYSLQISSRSAGHLVDRLILWDRDRYSLANKTLGSRANNTAFNALPNSGVVPEPHCGVLLSVATLVSALCRRPRWGTIYIDLPPRSELAGLTACQTLTC